MEFKVVFFFVLICSYLFVVCLRQGCFVLFLETESHIPQTVPKLDRYLKMASISDIPASPTLDFWNPSLCSVLCLAVDRIRAFYMLGKHSYLFETLHVCETRSYCVSLADLRFTVIFMF